MKPTFEDRMRQIKPLAEKQMPCTEIAAKLGLSVAYVHRLTRQGREQGILKDLRKHDALRYMTVGALGKELRGQEPGFTRWLTKNVPEGSTIAAFAVACLLDAYYDDLDLDN